MIEKLKTTRNVSRGLAYTIASVSFVMMYEAGKMQHPLLGVSAFCLMMVVLIHMDWTYENTEG